MRKVIEVKHLYKLYRLGNEVVRALDGVDFTIYEGEFCAIVGTSGSGKSTLLNMLAGLERPTKGEVIISGHHIEKLNEEQLVTFRREHVGFIFQSFHLLGTMDALENVALPLSFRGEPKEKRLKKAEKMLRLVGLEKHAKHLPKQMSGGQQQRVGVARALVVEPDIIFADEPTGNLDSHTSEEVMPQYTNSSAICLLSSLLFTLRFFFSPGFSQFPVILHLHNLTIYNMKYPVRVRCQMIIMSHHDKRHMLFSYHLLHKLHYLRVQ